MLDVVTGYLEKALKSRQTSSALSPLLWLNAIVTVPCLLLSSFISQPMCYAFFVLGVLIIFFSLYQYHALRKTNPRLLQSEKFQFELAKLDLVASKGGEVVINPVALEFGTEPIYLPGAAEDEGGER